MLKDVETWGSRSAGSSLIAIGRSCPLCIMRESPDAQRLAADAWGSQGAWAPSLAPGLPGSVIWANLLNLCASVSHRVLCWYTGSGSCRGGWWWSGEVGVGEEL